jgi:hypothetical protein
MNWLQSLADSSALALQHANLRQLAMQALSKAERLECENTLLRSKSAADDSPRIEYCSNSQRIQVGGSWMSIEEFLMQFANAAVVTPNNGEEYVPKQVKLNALADTQPLPQIDVQTQVADK